MARKETILNFDEIAAVAEVFVSLGIEKIRLTGGEPLIRRDIEKLTKKIAALKPPLKDLALTTNGFDLPRHVINLRNAGLDRVTISLDSLKPERFAEITGVDALPKVIDAIEATESAGFPPPKINAVIVRGRNDDELVDFARFARERRVRMRFIEFMPLDSGHEWSREMVVSGKEIYEAINAAFPLKLINQNRGSETAWKYSFADGSKGEIGIIAPVTQMFCGACSRIRLTADGQIRTCLFSTTEHNLRVQLRNGASRSELIEFIKNAVFQKEAHHRINEPDFRQPARTMSFIGG